MYAKENTIHSYIVNIKVYKAHNYIFFIKKMECKKSKIVVLKNMSVDILSMY